MEEETSIDEDRWLRFLEHVVLGLREAQRRIVTPPLKGSFEGRRGWFGKARKTKKGTRFPDETSLSQALYEVLREIRADQQMRSPVVDAFDLTRMEFAVEAPRRFERGIGPRTLPTDIMIAIAQDRIDFRIEAKNVLSSGSIKTEYAGRRGLERFDDPQSPYTVERYGAMLAYVVDKDRAHWSGEVTKVLGSGPFGPTMTTTSVGGETLTTTIHDRVITVEDDKLTGRCLTKVVHMVMEFDADPSLRP